MSDPSIVYCTQCGAAVNLPAAFCGVCGKSLSVSAPAAAPAPPTQIPPQPQVPQPAYGAAPQAPGVQCPFCHSTQVQAGKRGWKWYSGYIGAGNAVLTCMQCGKTFKPA